MMNILLPARFIWCMYNIVYRFQGPFLSDNLTGLELMKGTLAVPQTRANAEYGD